jgi:hypothetical protein
VETRSCLPASRRLVVAVSVLAGLAVLVGVTVLPATPALAENRTTTVSAVCSIGGLATAVSVPFTANDRPDPVTAGSVMTLRVQPGALHFNGVSAILQATTLTMSVPAQIASVKSVTFTGGNLTGSYQVIGSQLRVTFAGPVDAAAAQPPAFTVRATVRSNVGGQTITWPAPSMFDTQLVAGGTAFTAPCTTKAGTAPLNSTIVRAPGRIEAILRYLFCLFLHIC